MAQVRAAAGPRQLKSPRLIRFVSVVNLLEEYVKVSREKGAKPVGKRKADLMEKFRKKCVWRGCPDPDELFDIYRLLLPIVRLQRATVPATPCSTYH